MNTTPKEADQYHDPRLVALYDIINPYAADTAFYLAMAAQYQPEDIVDLGCGTGILTAELAKAGHGVIGIDPSFEMLNRARTRCEGVFLIQGTSAEIAPDSTDLIVMSGHVAQVFLDDEQWRGVLMDMYLGLRSGGRVIFETRNPDLKPWTDWNKQHDRAFVHPDFGKVTSWHEFVSLDSSVARYNTFYQMHTTDELLVAHNRIIFRSVETICQDLEDVGFTVEHVFGDWDMSSLSESCKEFIFVAKKG